MTQAEIKEKIQAAVAAKFACDAEDATQRQIYESVVNVAKAGIFASDRAVREYADNIWNLKPVE